MAQDGSALFEPLEAVAGAHGGTPSFEPMTGSGETLFGGVASTGQSAAFAPATASGTATGASVATGDASFEEMTGEGSSPGYGEASFEAATADGTSLTGTAASGDATFQPLSASAAATAVGAATGDGQFQYPIVSGTAYADGTASAAVSFVRSTASAAAFAGSIAQAAIDMLPVDGTASSYAPSVGEGYGDFLPAFAAGMSSSALGSTTRTWATNITTDALTEYRNFRFNSFAEFDGRYFAAGEDGVYELTGADDDGEAISWVVRSGFIDGKDPMLKRLDEILMSMRFDGDIRVRVWTDDNRVFSYTLNNYRPDVIHQVRVKLGRGLKSRFYRFELAGIGGSSAQISNVQLPFISTTRRVG